MGEARQLGALAGAASAGLLLAALAFQAAGYAPCELCILQRWPHLAAAGIGAALWVAPRGLTRVLTAAGMLAAAVATALALYHTGVEAGWWAGPSACTGSVGAMAQMSTDDLLAQLKATQPVRCDQPAVVLFGISMAGWNALASLGLTGLWGLALCRAGASRD